MSPNWKRLLVITSQRHLRKKDVGKSFGISPSNLWNHRSKISGPYAAVILVYILTASAVKSLACGCSRVFFQIIEDLAAITEVGLGQRDESLHLVVQSC